MSASRTRAGICYDSGCRFTAAIRAAEGTLEACLKINSTQMAPDRSEAAAYYFTYIDQAPKGDVCELLGRQKSEVLALFGRISDDESSLRYAPDKWSIREVVGHLSDIERLCQFRAFWFSRNLDSPLPSFDQTVAMTAAGANERSWASVVDEFRVVREASLVFFQSLPPTAWSRRGFASDNEFTVRALAYLAIGHVTHHTRILLDRYLRR